MAALKIRLLNSLVETMKEDLARPHPFARERIGFLSVCKGIGEDNSLILLPTDYRPVADEHYLEDPEVGARISSHAIRQELQHILNTGNGVLHVHIHEHDGKPRLSKTDLKELPNLVASMQSAKRDVPHGLLVLSKDKCRAWIRLPDEEKFTEPEIISTIGSPMTFSFEHPYAVAETRFNRQSFLGEEAQNIFSKVKVGVVGLGGGGSHVIQQLAHLGFKRCRAFDGDYIEDSNLNRLVGGTVRDTSGKTPKVVIAERIVKSLNPDADFKAHPGRWQEEPSLLRDCDLVFGCVDSFSERRELESICRRYLIPYIDIGMDVHRVEQKAARMAGQVILSMPGEPCMFCFGFLNETRLAQEAAKYGDAGDQPQVVWANGVLASTAVGLSVALLTGWTQLSKQQSYYSFDGNLAVLQPHPRLRYVESPCVHYPPYADVGDPVWQAVS